MLNLFTDETELRSLYPELVSDSRYLPSGRTDWVEQIYEGSKLVARRLKAKKAIVDESQILDINEVCAAATHATAYIILHPITKSDEEDARAMKAYQAMETELDETPIDLDYDNSGEIDTDEKDVSLTRTLRR